MSRSFHQSQPWMLFKKRQGWKCGSVKTDNNELFFYYKKYFGIIALIRITGHLDQPTTQISKKNISRIYKIIGPSVLSLFACNILNQDSSISLGFLRENMWFRYKRKKLSNSTSWIDLTKSPEDIRKKFSKNWRHNYKRGLKKNLKYSKLQGECAADVAFDILCEFREFKDIEVPFTLPELKQIYHLFKGNIVTYVGFDENQKPCSIRAYILEGDIAFDFLAAAVGNARKSYRSHVLLVECIMNAKADNAVVYDLGGVDYSNNRGVANFKNGVGGQNINYIGTILKVGLFTS